MSITLQWAREKVMSITFPATLIQIQWATQAHLLEGLLRAGASTLEGTQELSCFLSFFSCPIENILEGWGASEQARNPAGGGDAEVVPR